MVKQDSIVRITQVLDALGLPRSSWYRPSMPASERKRPGPAARPIPEPIVRLVIYVAKLYPWYGYKKIAVICRRAPFFLRGSDHSKRSQHGCLKEKIFVATETIVFDFELFIGDRCGFIGNIARLRRFGSGKRTVDEPTRQQPHRTLHLQFQPGILCS